MANEAKLKELALITEETERRAEQLALRIERFEQLKGLGGKPGSGGSAGAVGGGGGAGGVGQAVWHKSLVDKLNALVEMLEADQQRINALAHENAELKRDNTKLHYRLNHLLGTLNDTEQLLNSGAAGSAWVGNPQNPANAQFPPKLSDVHKLFANSPNTATAATAATAAVKK